MTTGQLIDLLVKDLKPEWSFNRVVLLAMGTGMLISASAFLIGVASTPTLPKQCIPGGFF